MRAGRGERGGNSGVKKLVWQWQNREVLSRNGCREVKVMNMSGTGQRELLWNRQLKLRKEWLTGDGQSH